MAKKLMVVGLLMCVLFVCACAISPAALPVSTEQTDARVLSNARVQYRNASIIVAGTCIQSHINLKGENCFDLLVSEVLAGDAGAGDLIHCASGSMDVGSEYLLYLGQSMEEVNYAEDTAGYILLSEAPLPILDSEVFWQGARVPLSALKEDIARLSEVISAPAPLQYYDTLNSLAFAAQEIFIGRVISLSGQTEQSFSIRNGGVAEKTQFPAEIAVVEAFGSIKGTFRYAQRIELVHCPARMGELVDAATLQPKGLQESQAAPLVEGGYYLFFLEKGPDDKQSYYFPINPLQGYVGLQAEELTVPAFNRTLSMYRELTPLVQALRESLRQVNGK